jgi:hypothetical protein
VILDDRLAFLSQADVFADLTVEELHAIVEAAPKRTYPVGELLCTQNPRWRPCSWSTVAV